MRIRPNARGMVYVGQDPTGTGVIKVAISEMTDEQLRGWYESAPAAVSRFVDFEPAKKTKLSKAVKAPKIEDGEQQAKTTDTASPTAG